MKQIICIISHRIDVVDDDHNDSDDNAIEWRCQCDSGWHGYDCSAPQETNCNDEIDNDNGI